MKEIPLTKGKHVIVDDEDYEKLCKHKWYAEKGLYTWYAVRGVRKDGKREKKEYMHAVIMSPPNGFIVDHKNRNGLNNCKENLRVCSNSQNQFNKIKSHSSKSKYKGLSWCKRVNKWMVYVTKHKKRFFLGYFEEEKIAAEMYDQCAVELFGDFALLNFPQNTYNPCLKIVEKITSKRKPQTSKYRGVSWNSKAKKWKCCVYVNGDIKYIGAYKDELVAAKKYDENIIKYNLDIKRLNFK
jgi:hypothetical protein